MNEIYNGIPLMISVMFITFAANHSSCSSLFFFLNSLFLGGLRHFFGARKFELNAFLNPT